MNEIDPYSTCPIWGTKARDLGRTDGRTLYHSPRAGGHYRVTETALALLRAESFSEWRRISLSETIFLGNRQGTAPAIDSQTLNSLKPVRKLGANELLDRILCALCDVFPNLGDEFRLGQIISERPGEYFAAAINAAGSSIKDHHRQVIFLLDGLEERGLITAGNQQKLSRITSNGWLKFEQLGYSLNQSDQIFVAMWFGSQEQTLLYQDAIMPAIQAAGYLSVRIDNTEHNEKIDDQIMAEIRKSKAVVVDLTCGLASPLDGWSKSQRVGAPRGGVFYEAGFAKGLGLPVIWTVKQSIAEMENVVHFDVRQFNQLRWTENLQDFSERLRFRIEATLGRGNATFT